jgi:hypothetical protein
MSRSIPKRQVRRRHNTMWLRPRHLIAMVGALVILLIGVAAQTLHPSKETFREREAKLHFFADRRDRLQNIAAATYASYCLGHRGLTRITLVEHASNGRVVVVTFDELYDVIVLGRKRVVVAIDCADGSRRVDRSVTVAPEWRKELLQEAAIAGG